MATDRARFEVRMKPKKILLAVGGIAVLYAVYVGISLMSLPSVSDLTSRRYNMTVQVKDWKGKFHPFVVGPRNRYWTPGGSIPAEMKWAVILAEDSRFYRHEGVDVKAIKNAIKYDLEKRSFTRGASTITQQVAKNLFLTREKTLTRKVKEIILAKRMEEVLTKGRIIELYLNVIELGPMVYGIGHGAQYYFGKPASALTPRECAFLAAMLPGPRVAYNPYKSLAKVLRRSDMILRLLRERGVLTEEEYRLALAEEPNINGLQKKVDESLKKEGVLANMSSATAVPLPLEKTDEIALPPEKGTAAPGADGALETQGAQGDEKPPAEEQKK